MSRIIIFLLGEVELIPEHRVSLERVVEHTSAERVNHGRRGYIHASRQPLSGDLGRRAPFPWPYPSAPEARATPAEGRTHPKAHSELPGDLETIQKRIMFDNF